MPGGRPKGSPNKRTVQKLIETGREIAKAKLDVPRAKNTLADLMQTATGFTAMYQRKLLEFEADPANAGKLPPAELVDRFMMGLNTAIRAARALAPFQDPQFSAIRAAMSPLDVPDAPKVVEGKATKIDLNDPIELARIYHSLVRAA